MDRQSTGPDVKSDAKRSANLSCELCLLCITVINISMCGLDVCVWLSQERQNFGPVCLEKRLTARSPVPFAVVHNKVNK